MSWKHEAMGVLVACLPLAAQERAVLRPVRSAAEETLHQISRLRSESTRSHACYALWRLGRQAVPGLLEGASGADERTAIACIRILGLCGTEARAAVDGLETLCAEPGSRAVAARWALARIRSSGVLLVSTPVSNQMVELEPDGTIRQTPVQVRGIRHGVRIGPASYLVCTGQGDRIRELDWRGRETWASPRIPEIRGAWPLPNGNLIVVRGGQGGLVELDRRDQVRKERRGLDAVDVELLVDGNLLVSDRGGKAVLELDRDLQPVRRFEVPSPVTAAHRMPNGNTLVASTRGVVREVDMAGQVLHTYRGLPGVGDVESTEDGTVLVAWDRGVTAFLPRNGELWRFRSARCSSVSR